MTSPNPNQFHASESLVSGAEGALGEKRKSHPESISPELVEVRFFGFATATPAYGATSLIAAEMAKKLSTDQPSQHRTIDALYRRTRIDNRGSVLLDADLGDGAINDFYPPKQTERDRGPGTQARGDRYAVEAPKLAFAAASGAINLAAVDGIDHQSITHLVTVSCTGFTAPGVDVALISGLGLSPRTERIQVGFMGCHGAINGIRAARGLCLVDPKARVLVVSVELCSLHYQYGFDADRIISGALFADGAAAFVMGQSLSAEDALKPSLVATGSYLIENSQDEMTWRMGDHGFEMTLSATVPDLIESHLAEFLVGFLEAQGETISSVGGWAVHPGGPRILQAVENGLGLPEEALATSREILRQNGNMSSATMLFILKAFERKRQPKPWLMLGFGPGLEIEAALIR